MIATGKRGWRRWRRLVIETIRASPLSDPAWERVGVPGSRSAWVRRVYDDLHPRLHPRRLVRLEVRYGKDGELAMFIERTNPQFDELEDLLNHMRVAVEWSGDDDLPRPTPGEIRRANHEFKRRERERRQQMFRRKGSPS